MLNVLEFIREKKADFKDNTEQYRIKLEPKFRSLSNRLNHKLKNTLNNPWLSNFKSIDSSYFFGQRRAEPNPTIQIVNSKINGILGKEIFKPLCLKFNNKPESQIQRYIRVSFFLPLQH